LALFIPEAVNALLGDRLTSTSSLLQPPGSVENVNQTVKICRFDFSNKTHSRQNLIIPDTYDDEQAYNIWHLNCRKEVSSTEGLIRD